MRKISLFKAEKIKHKNYPHIQSFIKVERTGLRRNKKSEETFYYISSKVLPSKKNCSKNQRTLINRKSSILGKRCNF
jgi:hypothetical protein